jgi:hypothetical protein
MKSGLADQLSGKATYQDLGKWRSIPRPGNSRSRVTRARVSPRERAQLWLDELPKWRFVPIRFAAGGRCPVVAGFYGIKSATPCGSREIRRDCYRFRKFCHEEAIDEIAGREAGTHGTECFQVGDEFGAMFRGQGPELFVFDDVQAEVPGFRAIEREVLAMDDVQATRNQKVAIVIHSAEFDHHALLDRLDEFLFVGR